MGEGITQKISSLPNSVKIIGGGVILAAIIYIYKKTKGASTSTGSTTTAAQQAQLAAEQAALSQYPTVNNSGTTGSGLSSAQLSSLGTDLSNSFGTLGQQLQAAINPLTGIPGAVNSTVSGISTGLQSGFTAITQGLGTLSSQLTGAMASSQTALSGQLTAQTNAMQSMFTSQDPAWYFQIGMHSLADCIQSGNVSQWCANTIGANEASRNNVNFNDPNAIKQYVQTTYGSCTSGGGYDPVCVGKKIAQQIGYGG